MQDFLQRHLGPSVSEQQAMLKTLGFDSLDALMAKVLPDTIKSKWHGPLTAFDTALSESSASSRLAELSRGNQVFRSYIGQGYYNCLTPAVIRRSILENPGWYTQYTPYQAEISQGRLEALFNFQTMISRLTGFGIANASLLDEATAVAEAVAMCHAAVGEASRCRVVVADLVFSQTLSVLKTRAAALSFKVDVQPVNNFKFGTDVFACVIQSPDTHGVLLEYSEIAATARAQGIKLIVAADPLALMISKSPAALGADIAVGSTQRFGVPLFFGGPHAAYLATSDEFKRLLPGRIIGLSRDASGQPAYRLALQTREQHIRREKATSNICTAQVLLAVIASMYAVYHGDLGLKKIAQDVYAKTNWLRQKLTSAGFKTGAGTIFDTVVLSLSADQVMRVRLLAEQKKINFNFCADNTCRIALDETVTTSDLTDILNIFEVSQSGDLGFDFSQSLNKLPQELDRQEAVLTDSVFNSFHSETEFLRYVKRLESRDLSLTAAMIPLGSCTMKLNAASEMFPVSWPEFSQIHPLAPSEQVQGYQSVVQDLESALAEMSGLSAVSLQPNAGSQGEYAGLLAIRAYYTQQSNGGELRNICLIPKSAHGTNPASAVMAGFEVVTVLCDAQGNVDFEDLKNKCALYQTRLAALMVTYPSTHGVFEENIKEICSLIHQHGGQVYMDGANYNALVGWCRPGELGVDVMHFNLHKTFCIPHGGGGPGVGPIAVAAHLKPYLPADPVSHLDAPAGAVSAANYGSAGILVIPWMYLAMMSASGLKQATAVAILNANYIAKRLSDYYPLVYAGKDGLVAHECILDLRSFKASAGVEVEDVAKRLMDYAFHAPTVSWPVIGSLMVEPTESESKVELDRFCDAMISIWHEIKKIEQGEWPQDNNPLKHAPHTAEVVVAEAWNRPYSREVAAFPDKALRDRKFWPYVSRVDGVYGDRNLVCACAPIA